MTKKISLVILERPNNEVALQLRDDKATIAHPNSWALFGGKIEGGESSHQAALREGPPSRKRAGLVYESLSEANFQP